MSVPQVHVRGHGPWRSGRGLRLNLVAAVVVLLVGVVVLLVGGCTSPGRSGSAGSTPPTPSPSAVIDPVVRLSATGQTASYLTPVRLVVADGSLTSVQVDGQGGAPELDGTVDGDGTSWVSQAPPKPASSYRVVAAVKDSAGRARSTTLTFKVAPVPDNQKVSFTVTPSDGATVGIGQPIVIRFLTPITRRTAMEKVMLVTARTAAGRAVTGSWHWLDAQEVHWRPEKFWTPGTKVRLDLRIAGVRAAEKRYGRKDYAQTFTIGASHVTQVNASSHRVQVYRDGKLTDTWPTGTGRPGLETYSGTYIVLGKSPVLKMDSCSARITCDKKNPDYYDENEYWATRITASGTFLHAADWDGVLGRANISHGCIHLSGADAKDFYNRAVIGDVVVVSNTGRGPQQRIATKDPGLYDWNLSWSAWTAGSALH